MSKIHALLGAAALALCTQSQAGVITFDNIAAKANTSSFSGFNFSSIFGTSIQHTATGFFADAGVAAFNGTDYLTALQQLTITSATSSLFSVKSLDLVGFMGLLDGATLIGTRKDNTTISYSANFSGTANAFKWGGNDFTRITLNSFTELKSLTITARGIGALAVDNVNISAVPEPGTLSILALGLGALAYGRRRKSA